MPETSLVKCYLCGKEGNTLEMAIAGSPVVGPICDLALAVDYFCKKPCFSTFRDSSSRVRQRVYQRHNRIAWWATASVDTTPDEELDEMAALPEGLKISPEEKARIQRLRGKLTVENLQDRKDQLAVLKVCRNRNENDFRHPKTGRIRDYETLRRDFANLEKLTPEERRKLE